MRHPVSSLTPSNQRFSVDYRLAGDEKAAGEKARDICLEQTVEVPDALVPDGMIRDQVLGRIEAFAARPDGGYVARISYAVEIAGTDLTQLLNVLFGNISIKAGIRADRLDLPETMRRAFRGPRFGRAGLRALGGAALAPPTYYVHLVSVLFFFVSLPFSKLAHGAYRLVALTADELAWLDLKE